MQYLTYIILVVASLAVLLYFIIARIQKVLAINKAFYASGYHYVLVTTNAGRIHKGFITHASLRVFRSGESNTNIQLKFHRDGETLIIPMQNIRDIKLVRPPLFNIL